MGSDKFFKFNYLGIKCARLSVLTVSFLAIFAIFSTDFCTAATPENPTSLTSPVGSPTVPITSKRSGLQKSRSESHIAERNLAITGNVSGGKHFRGDVPYNSSTQFGAPVGSDLFNSFIRRSSGTTTGYTSPGKYNPYFSPSKTVTSLKRDGASGLDTPVNPFAGGTGKYKLPPNSSYNSNLPSLRQYDRRGDFDSKRPFSLSPDEIAEQINYRSAERDIEMETFENELYNALEVSKRISRQLEEKYDQESGKKTDDKAVSKTQDSESLKKTEESNKVIDPDRSLELIKERYRKAQLQAGENKAAEIAELQDRLIYPENQPGREKADSKADAHSRNKKDSADSGKNAKDDSGSGFEAVNRQMEQFRKSHTSLSRERARQAIDDFANFEQKVNEKYNHYMQTAEQKIKDGKYYTALDCYELARIWKDDGGRARIGKAYAALAAGEFVTSSNNFIWAIEDGGKEAIAKFGPADLIDPVLFKRRIDEIIALNEDGGFYKTVFMQAFIAYQNGDAATAGECLDATSGVMGESKAWKTLNTAVEQMQNRD